MSNSNTHDAVAHTHGEDHDYEETHGSLKGYLIGFFASVVLTAIPFWLVMGEVLSSSLAIATIILALGAVQIYVHLVYFLHVDTSQEGGWQFMTMAFSIIVLFIVLVGSVWVMGHLDANMMLQPQSNG